MHAHLARSPNTSRAGNRRNRVALMDSYPVATKVTMDQCTQTPFPGSELLDPNPFVPSPSGQARGHARHRRKAGPRLGLGEPALTTLPHRGTTSHRAETDHCVAGGCAGQAGQDSTRQKRVRTLFTTAGEGGVDQTDYSDLTRPT